MNDSKCLCILTGVFLAGNAFTDIRKREISLLGCAAYVLAVCFLRAGSGLAPLFTVGRMLPGFVFLLAFLMLPRAIGFGDVILIFALAGGPGPEELWEMIILDLFISLAMGLAGKAKTAGTGDGREGVPFAFFLFFGFILKNVINAAMWGGDL